MRQGVSPDPETRHTDFGEIGDDGHSFVIVSSRFNSRFPISV